MIEEPEREKDDFPWGAWQAGKTKGKDEERNRIRQLHIGEGAVFEFTIANFPEFQRFIDDVMRYHDELKAENERIRTLLGNVRLLAKPISADPLAKPRVRVRAGSSVTNSEVWIQLEGADPEYQISSHGRFRNLKKGILRPRNSYGKMLQVTVGYTINGRRRNVIFNAAKAVAMAFSRVEGFNVLHFYDGNRFNIEPANMVWLDASDARVRAGDFAPDSNTTAMLRARRQLSMRNAS